ncbi:MAG: hypothetical protein KDK70_21145 [Myxococcales bacterium]|nr:hypothetical protein [Myxococcales bacterium]
MTTTTKHPRWLGSALAVAVGLGGVLMSAEAEAAPTPNEKIRGKGGNVGLGLSMGDPLGPSFKWFIVPRHALQSDLGWAPLHHGHGRFGVDYLFHPGSFGNNSVVDFVPYFGVGLGVMFWGGYYYGNRRHGRYYYRYDRGGAGMFMRAPIVGFALHWKNVPIDTVTEFSWAPYIVYPDLAHADFSIKVRYYF